MQEVKVLVPDERVPEFYQFFGAWLAGDSSSAEAVGPDVFPWGESADDLALARVVWQKLSPHARGLFNLLMETPEKKVSGETLAERLRIPNGKYGVAGVLAWPARYCYAVGRALPVRYEDGPVGESANYWMSREVAAIFAAARDQ